MNERRLDLGLSWREAALRSGISYEAIRNLRSGTGGVEALTLRKIDKGLDWPGGTAQQILAEVDGDAVPEFLRRAARLDAGKPEDETGSGKANGGSRPA
jgi:hypothetical protein